MSPCSQRCFPSVLDTHSLTLRSQDINAGLKYSRMGVSRGAGLHPKHRCPRSGLCLHVYIAKGQCRWRLSFLVEALRISIPPRATTLRSYLGKGLTGVLQPPDRRFPALPSLPHCLLSPPVSPSESAAETDLQTKGFCTMMACCKISARISSHSHSQGFFYPNATPSETC